MGSRTQGEGVGPSVFCIPTEHRPNVTAMSILHAPALKDARPPYGGMETLGEIP